MPLIVSPSSCPAAASRYASYSTLGFRSLQACSPPIIPCGQRMPRCTRPRLRSARIRGPVSTCIRIGHAATCSALLYRSNAHVRVEAQRRRATTPRNDAAQRRRHSCAASHIGAAVRTYVRT
ncbi:uncharacterized protein UV8b_07773 [Ustilaginoidea virens]|uniref:Uncharacterized protein n=1 Tax=Ustilaginoidea virens TaxID=1159556 RepID=A0A8E5HXZ0_USTVR|nr:uncharacterized protein UV8b_07773 [Ustilaginoidea virens]QUC23532.1 hypothetical protein UV8b_07773 [Ustilaginoidea virens]